MPKIELQEKSFFEMLGNRPTAQEFAELLSVAKAEIDDWQPQENSLKIELNDTNRPDLWSGPGLVRQLRAFREGSTQEYPFMSKEGSVREVGERVIQVDRALKEIRPYIAAFIARGVPVTEPMLVDMINAQEKLCWNYGRKRSTIAMGVYRADLMNFPVHYRAADPEKTRFIPLDYSWEMSLREILKTHPKGVEFGWIVENFERFPYLEDDSGQTLSFPPIINSAHLGAVEVGDSHHFIELTGPDLDSLLVACSIVACDFADLGFEILPVRVNYPFDTAYGRELVTPYYFQKPVCLEVSEASRLLGETISIDEAETCVRRLGSPVSRSGNTLTVSPPPYRNDFLHPVDVIEEIMIGRGMTSFEPVWPEEFTVGRLSEIEHFSREVREILVGQGYQEMIYSYLGSRRDFVDRMNGSPEDIIEIENPMSESFALLRNSQLPNLLYSESISSNAVYPHCIFEVGKVAYLDEKENYGSRTVTGLSFLFCDREASFNDVNSHLSAVFFYLSREYTLEPLEDPRFVPGRAGAVVYRGRRIGVIGEIHPAVLENWGIQQPAAAVEIELDGILEVDSEGR
ncbi:MAG: phenylalanine--tRNA ligase subunit beta [Spirochaetaceae bacterium]|nr:MAG: phenylalanine--tRNA ligase subunit beta [Spirochaetaceae bacterium]